MAPSHPTHCPSLTEEESPGLRKAFAFQKSNTANYLNICHEHCFTMAKFNMATELRLVKDTLEHYSQLLPFSKTEKTASCINNSYTLVIGSCIRHSIPLVSLLINIKHFHAFSIVEKVPFNQSISAEKRYLSASLSHTEPPPPTLLTKA